MSDPHDSSDRPSATGLAGHLRALREATRPHISQTRAGDAIKASQNKISRIESAEWVPTPTETRTLCRLYGASRDETQTLARWAAALQTQNVKSGTLLHRAGGTASFQRKLGRIEENSRLVRAFQPAMVLGVLQTEAYAQAVFGEADTAGIAARMERARRLLAEPSRRWELVQPVGAYLWNLGGHEVMAEQMDAIVAISQLPNVDLRVVTPRQVVSFNATHGFHLYGTGDQVSVVVGILTGTSTTTAADDVAMYTTQFERLQDVAVGGAVARQELARLAEQYREMREGSTRRQCR